MAESKEVEMLDVMRDKVLRGEEIVVTGELGNSQAQFHGAMVDRLMRETGKPVRVVHMPVGVTA